MIYPVDVNTYHLAEGIFLRSLHCGVIAFPVFLDCTLWKKITMSSIFQRVWNYTHMLKILGGRNNYIDKCFGIIFDKKSVLSATML